nr:hypothetical protein [Exiguobacterium sp.]
MLGWGGVLVPFVEAGNERVARLEMTVRIYERLQGEVVKDADEPGGRLAVCEGDHCLPTL